MGDWYGTCMGTNLPIMFGEETTMVMLLENPYSKSSVYPTHTFCPFLAVHGEYDSYGRLENVQHEETVMEILKSLPGLKAMNRDNQLEPYTVTDFASFIDATEEGLYVTEVRGVVKELAKDKLAVRAVFLKNGFADLMDNLVEYRSMVTQIEELLDKTMSEVVLYHAKDSAPGKKTKEEESDTFKMRWQLLDSIRELFSYVISSSYPQPTASQVFTNMWLKFPEFAKENTRMVTKANCICNYLRIAWHIPSGAGSQHSVDTMQRAYLQFYEETLNELEHYFDD